AQYHQRESRPDDVDRPPVLSQVEVPVLAGQEDQTQRDEQRAQDHGSTAATLSLRIDHRKILGPTSMRGQDARRRCQAPPSTRRTIWPSTLRPVQRTATRRPSSDASRPFSNRAIPSTALASN